MQIKYGPGLRNMVLELEQHLLVVVGQVVHYQQVIYHHQEYLINSYIILHHPGHQAVYQQVMY